MKRLIPLILVSVFLWGNAMAQDNKITVLDFRMNETDNTSNLLGSTVYDQNGDKCALIKIRTNQEGFSFDVGALGITKVIQKVGEIWLYVPYRVKKLTLFHSTLATLEYKFSFPLEPARTYIMELKSKEIFDNVIDDNTKTGKLDIEVYPPTASVVLNNIPVKLNKDGKEQVDLFYGRYTYKITEENHYPFEGRIKINSQKTETLKIRLKQAYGWLHLANNEGIKDAVVYVDEVQIDSTTNKARIPVKHGKHSLKIENPLYHTYTAEFSIEDSTVTNMQVNLQPNYGTVTLIANDPLSSIYVDNIAKGKGSWTGKVSVGNHIFECRRGAHIPSSRTINIGNGTNITVPLDAPTPIYGTIDINTTPEGATVYINDTLAGTTPLRRNDIIIGEKQIRIEKEFYTTENRNIKISSDSTTSLSVVMTNIVPVKITSNIDSTNLYLNGKHIGFTPYADTLNGGEYKLHLDAGKKYRAINDIIDITPANNTFHYKLKKNYTRDYELYLDFDRIIMSSSKCYGYGYDKNFIPGINLGAFINKINLEFGFEYITYHHYRDFYMAVSNSSDIYSFEIYSNRGLSAQTGYSITLSNRLRITPQVGIKLNSVKMDAYEQIDTDYGYDEIQLYDTFYAYKIGGTASCRITFAFLPFMGLSITPSYRIPIKTSTSYKFYEDAMGLAKKGFSLKAGIVIFIKM